MSCICNTSVVFMKVVEINTNVFYFNHVNIKMMLTRVLNWHLLDVPFVVKDRVFLDTS